MRTRRRRRRGRNAWFGARARHRKAALKGWGGRRRGRKGRKKCRNPLARNGRRRRGRRLWSNPLGGIGKVVSMGNLKEAGAVVAGSMGAAYLSGKVGGMLAGTVPMIDKGVGRAALGLGSALLLGRVPRFGSGLQIGALAATITGLVGDLMAGRPLFGFSDYLTLRQVQDARQLNGMHDYLTVPQVQAARLLQGMDGGFSGSGISCYDDEMGM